MIREATESACAEEDIELRPPISRREVISIRQTQEELGVAPCPLCQAPLVARQGRRGPYFFCRCVAKPKRQAS